MLLQKLNNLKLIKIFRAVYFNWFGLFLILTLCLMIGSVMFADIGDCDPMKFAVKKKDEVFVENFLTAYFNFINKNKEYISN